MGLGKKTRRSSKNAQMNHLQHFSRTTIKFIERYFFDVWVPKKILRAANLLEDPDKASQQPECNDPAPPYPACLFWSQTRTARYVPMNEFEWTCISAICGAMVMGFGNTARLFSECAEIVLPTNSFFNSDTGNTFSKWIKNIEFNFCFNAG